METEKKFLDEDIISRRRKYRQLNVPSDLSAAPRYIGDRRITFEQENIPGMLSVYLPSGLSELSESEMKEYFLTEQKPDIVRADYNRSAFFLFQAVSGSQEDVTAEGLALKRSIDMLYPQNVFYEFKTELTVSNAEVFWFEYKSFGLEIERYNFQFLFEVYEKKYIVGKFICRFPNYMDWKKTMIDIVKTIRPPDAEI